MLGLSIAVIPFHPPPHIELPGPFALSAHGVAFLIAAVVSLTLAKRRSLPEHRRAFDDAIPYMMLGAVLGARVVYFARSPELWSQPQRILAFWEGGLVSYGGMAGALLPFLWFLKRQGYPLAKLTDALAPTVLIGWAIGRIGCFLSWYGEYGTISRLPWAFEVDGIPRHPVMLYLSLVLFIAGVVLMRLPTEPAFRVSALSLMSYGGLRLICDYWRDYESVNLTWASRITCVVIVIIGLALLRRSPHVRISEETSQT